MSEQESEQLTDKDSLSKADLPAVGSNVTVAYQSVYGDRDTTTRLSGEVAEIDMQLRGHVAHVYVRPDDDQPDKRKDDYQDLPKPRRRIVFLSLDDGNPSTVQGRNGLRWNRISRGLPELEATEEP